MALESRPYSTGGTRLLQLLPSIQGAATTHLDGISMNIQEENAAHYFRVQSEREQTLIKM